MKCGFFKFALTTVLSFSFFVQSSFSQSSFHPIRNNPSSTLHENSFAIEASDLEVLAYTIKRVVQALIFLFRTFLNSDSFQNVRTAFKNIWNTLSSHFASPVQSGYPLPALGEAVEKSLALATKDDPEMNDFYCKLRSRHTKNSTDGLPQTSFPFKSDEGSFTVLKDQLVRKGGNRWNHQFQIKVSNIQKNQKLKVLSWTQTQKGNFLGEIVGRDLVTANPKPNTNSIIVSYNYNVTLPFVRSRNPQKKSSLEGNFFWGLDIPPSENHPERRVYVSPGRLVQ